jgi:RibD C-terminal domain
LAKVIVGMTISLDGFVADQDGNNAGRIYPHLAALRDSAYMKDLIEQTGAVLMGTIVPPRVVPKQDSRLMRNGINPFRVPSRLWVGCIRAPECGASG